MRPRLQALCDPDVFKQLLSEAPLARGHGWALHGKRTVRGPTHNISESKLSTGVLTQCPPLVDDSTSIVQGVVLAKRLIRRAVSRNQVRRIWRELVVRQSSEWIGWTLVLRRREPWPLQALRSATSPAMRTALQLNLAFLLDEARRRRDQRTVRPASPSAHGGPRP